MKIGLIFSKDESGESDDEHFYPATSDSDLDQSCDGRAANQQVTVAVDDVYRPPTELHRVGHQSTQLLRMMLFLIVLDFMED